LTRQSPLFTRDVPTDEYSEVLLALTVNSIDPKLLDAVIAGLATSPLGTRLVEILDARDDLPAGSAARMIGARPDLRLRWTAVLRAKLFPSADGCHRFVKTICAMAYAPESIDRDYVQLPRFAALAGEADDEFLAELLAPLLAASQTLASESEAVLRLLVQARAEAGSAGSTFQRLATARLAKAQLAHATATLNSASAAAIKLLDSGGSVGRPTQLWLGAIIEATRCGARLDDAVGYVEWVTQRLAETTDSGTTPAASHPFALRFPEVARRWSQIQAAALTSRSSGPLRDRWSEALINSATTATQARYELHQRPLVAAYALAQQHVESLYAASADRADAIECWVSNADGRALMRFLADTFTGMTANNPLHRFSDELILSFLHGIAKNRRDRVPGDLQKLGVFAAVKAARSKLHLFERSEPLRLGIVIPMRDEEKRVAPWSELNPGGQDAARIKISQIQWLMAEVHDAKVDLVFVDESDDPAATVSIAATVARIQRGGEISDPERLTVTVMAADPSLLGQGEELLLGAAKGWAVKTGLRHLQELGCHEAAFVDLDLTYSLEHIGLLLAHTEGGSGGVAMASRRQEGSYGYYPPSGPNHAARLYQAAVAEVLDIAEVDDPQAGFKAFPGRLLSTLTERSADNGLTFDTELLVLAKSTGMVLHSVPMCTFHRYGPDGSRTPRDYGHMLERVRTQADIHGVAPGRRGGSVLQEISAQGGFDAAAAKRQGLSKGMLAIRPAPKADPER
jgi:hypothetical protein